MKWKNILFRLQQLSEAELDEEALVFNPFYQRTFAVEAFGSIGHITEKPDERKVIVVSKEARA